MTVDKIRLKALFAEDLGRGLEKDLEAAQTKIHKWQGAHEALLQSAKIISDKCGGLKDKLLSGEIQLDASDPMVAAKFVVAQIQAIAVMSLHEHAEIAKTSAQKAAGEYEGLDFSLKKVKAIFDEERTKLENIAKAIEDGAVRLEPDGSLQALGDGPRYPGAHPGPTLKQQRTAVPPPADDPGDHGTVHLDGFEVRAPLSQEAVASTVAPKRRGRRRKGNDVASDG